MSCHRALWNSQRAASGRVFGFLRVWLAVTCRNCDTVEHLLGYKCISTRPWQNLARQCIDNTSFPAKLPSLAAFQLPASKSQLSAHPSVDALANGSSTGGYLPAYRNQDRKLPMTSCSHRSEHVKNCGHAQNFGWAKAGQGCS